MCTLSDAENRCALGAGASYAVATYRASAWSGTQPVKRLNKEKPPHCGSGPLALLFHYWGLLLPPWAAPPASASLLPKKWHLWPTERSGPQTPMEETNHLEHERGNTVSSQSPLSLQHILGCRKRENSSSVLLEPEDWWLWPPPLQATVRVSNSTWLGLFLSLWFSKENGQLNCFKNNMKGFWNFFFF